LWRVVKAEERSNLMLANGEDEMKYPKCPKCNAEIDCLYARRRNAELEYFLCLKDGEAHDEIILMRGGEVVYSCLNCGADLFYSDDDEINFLAGEVRTDCTLPSEGERSWRS